MTKITGGGTATEVIAAPADQLWSMVADVTRIGEWSPEAVGAEWIDGATGPAVGARFRGHNRRGKTRWSTTCEVIECEPGSRFAFATKGAAKPETIWRYEFEPLAAGTRVTESFELVKPLGSFSNLVTRVTTGVKDRRADLEQGARETLAALRRAMDSGPVPPAEV